MYVLACDKPIIALREEIDLRLAFDNRMEISAGKVIPLRTDGSSPRYDKTVIGKVLTHRLRYARILFYSGFVVRNFVTVGGHSVDARDGAQADRVIVSALVAHYAHRPNIRDTSLAIC